MDIHRLFCTNLSKIRVQKKLTQEGLAEKLGVSVKYYQRLENGWKRKRDWPSPAKIKTLAKALKCKESDFFTTIKKP